MKVVFTDDALSDLAEIFQFISEHYPGAYRPFETRLRTIVARIGRWPESAQAVEQRTGVRSVPFIRYPYKLFYRVVADRIEILHVHHAALQEQDD